MTPLVFRHNGKRSDCCRQRRRRALLLDSASLGGTDHRTPLARTRVSTGRFAERLRAGKIPKPALDGFTRRSASIRVGGRGPRGVHARAARRPAGADAAMGRRRDIVGAGCAGGREWSPVRPVDRQREQARDASHSWTRQPGKPLFTSGDAVAGTAQSGNRTWRSRTAASTSARSTTRVYSFGIPTEH